jgi:hypothetical protein
VALLLAMVMSLLAGMMSVADSEMSLLRVMMVDVLNGALLIASLSSVSLLTTLLDAPNAKEENPLLLLNTETKPEKTSSTTTAATNTKENIVLQCVRCKPVLDLTIMSYTTYRLE